MNQLKIGIVGGGIAGSAAANFLARQGHHITVFEREENPRPLGAGIMMQPTGYKMMSLLGFKDLIDENSTPIYKFQGVLNRSNEVVIDIDFRDLYPEACGRGVHRGLLFSTLIKALDNISNVNLLTGTPIDNIEQNEKKVTLYSGQHVFDEYDFVIISNGSRSMLRNNFSVTKKSIQQPNSALWTTVTYKKGELDETTLTQHYGDKVLTGIMPTGSHIEGDVDTKLVNFFWGVNQQENPINSAADFKKLREQIKVYYGDSPIADRVVDPEQLTFAPYYDSQLSHFYEGRVAFVGDVAHAMSPQLSSGTNLALLDAYMLSECIEEHEDLHSALRSFSKKRTQQVHYYQTISRLITPIFQGDKQYPFLRDFLIQKVYDLPVAGKLMLSTLMGIRNGWCSKLPKRYYI